ncbi:MAG TPA: hypothetical protein PKW18_14120 [Candidatus Sumerlaeota bacterium]|nr:hypothetical protein [Candidatus Sumerlaeota bacterium]
MDKLWSRKLILTITAMVLVTIVTIVKSDMAAWFVGAIATLVGSYNIGQGLSDKARK